jgi:hypothetical protein
MMSQCAKFQTDMYGNDATARMRKSQCRRISRVLRRGCAHNGGIIKERWQQQQAHPVLKVS